MCSGSLWSGVGVRAQPEAGVRVSLPSPALSSVRSQLAQKAEGEVPAWTLIVLAFLPAVSPLQDGRWKLPLGSEVGEGNFTRISLGDLMEQVCLAPWGKGRRREETL